MKKLISYVKQFVAEFKKLFREYDSLKDPVSIEKRQEQKAFIVTGLVFLVPIALILILLRQPLLALLRVLLLTVPIGVVFWLLIKSADMMDNAEPQHPVISYPVFRGFQPGSNYCQAAIIDEEFKDIADFFDSCYFDHFVDQVKWNCVIYVFRIRPKKDMPVSYELLDLIQHICEKKASVFFSENGLYRVYSNVVACNFGHNVLQIAFAYNPQGEAQIVKLRNEAYRQWHQKQAQDNASASGTMTEDVPEIPLEDENASEQDKR